MNKKILSLGLIAIITILSACKPSPYLRNSVVEDSLLVERNHIAGEALVAKSMPYMKARSPILYASFVNVDDLSNSSSLGRIMSQQVTTPFANKGYYVIEMLLRNSAYIKEREGEFLLSRELKNISNEHNAQAVIVGSYAVGGSNVYVTAKLIDVRNSKVVTSYDYSIPLTEDIKKLVN